MQVILDLMMSFYMIVHMVTLLFYDFLVLIPFLCSISILVIIVVLFELKLFF